MKLKSNLMNSKSLKLLALIVLIILVMNSEPIFRESKTIETRITAFKYTQNSTVEDHVVQLYFKGRVIDKFNKKPYFEGIVSIDNQVFNSCIFKCIEGTDLIIKNNDQEIVIANISTDYDLNEVVIDQLNGNYFEYSNQTIIAGPAIRKEDAIEIYK